MQNKTNLLIKVTFYIIIFFLILSDILYSDNYPIYSIIILILLIAYYVISPKIR